MACETPRVLLDRDYRIYSATNAVWRRPGIAAPSLRTALTGALLALLALGAAGVLVDARTLEKRVEDAMHSWGGAGIRAQGDVLINERQFQAAMVLGSASLRTRAVRALIHCQTAVKRLRRWDKAPGS